MTNTTLGGKKIFAALFLALLFWGVCASATGEAPTQYYVNPLNLGGDGTDTLADFIILAIKALLSLVGIFALIFLVVGGIRYIIAAGDNAAMQAAKHTVTSALTGIALALLAYGLVDALEQILRIRS